METNQSVGLQYKPMVWFLYERKISLKQIKWAVIEITENPWIRFVMKSICQSVWTLPHVVCKNLSKFEVGLFSRKPLDDFCCTYWYKNICYIMQKGRNRVTTSGTVSGTRVTIWVTFFFFFQLENDPTLSTLRRTL